MIPLRWHLRISLAALSLMLIVPFVYPHHYQPIPSFYQEWGAVAFSLLALTVLLRRAVLERLEMPSIALLPLGLGALALIEFAGGRVVFPGEVLLFLLYLLWAVVMLILGSSLRHELGLDGLVTPLAYALLGGGLLAAALLGVQLSGAQLGAGIVFQRTGAGIGNLGQPNHLANYLWLALASAVTLYGQGRVGKRTLAFCALPLLCAASLTGSRSVWLYAAGFTLLSVWAAWRCQQPALRKTARAALLLLPLTLLMQWLLAYFNVGGWLSVETSGERFFQLVSGTSVRLQLWRTGLTVFADHPWLGAGVGRFPWESYVLVGAQADSSYFSAEHAHNLLVHLLAELGIVAPLLALLLSWRWWQSFVRQTWSPARWWIAAVLLVETVHSQLEYPLWYAFFLGVTALALGAGSGTKIRLRISRLGQPILALMLLLGGLTLFTLGNDYGKLEKTLNPQLSGGSDPAQWAASLETLNRLHRESLLGAYVELVYAYSLNVDRERIKDKIVVTERAVRFSPAELIAFKLAYLLALDGRLADAQLALRRALATHPAARPQAIVQLKNMVKNYPELTSLLEQIEARNAPPNHGA